MKKHCLKISSAMSSLIMMVAICMVLSVSLTGCGKKGTEDTGDSSTQNEQNEIDESNTTAKSDAITGLVGTPSDYSKEDNWMVQLASIQLIGRGMIPMLLPMKTLEAEY